MKSWLLDNDVEMYSTYDEGKSSVGERFIRTLKKQNLQIYDFNIKKYVYQKIADLVNVYNKPYQSTIKMRPADVNQVRILTLLLKIMIKNLQSVSQSVSQPVSQSGSQ